MRLLLACEHKLVQFPERLLIMNNLPLRLFQSAFELTTRCSLESRVEEFVRQLEYIFKLRTCSYSYIPIVSALYSYKRTSFARCFSSVWIWRLPAACSFWSDSRRDSHSARIALSSTDGTDVASCFVSLPISWSSSKKLVEMKGTKTDKENLV